LKFSFKKRININGNQNKVKSPDDNLNDGYSTIKNNKNHYSKENEDKREIININNNTVKINTNFNERTKKTPFFCAYKYQIEYSNSSTKSK